METLPAQKALNATNDLELKLKKIRDEQMAEVERLSKEIQDDETTRERWEERMKSLESNAKDPIEKLLVRLEDLNFQMSSCVNKAQFDGHLDLFMRYFFVGFGKNLEYLKDRDLYVKFIERYSQIWAHLGPKIEPLIQE